MESTLAAAERIAPLAASMAEQIERDRRLPEELVRELLDGGLLGLCLPRALGGREADPAEMVTALERLARGDGSTAWCAMICSTSGLLGAYLQDEDAARVYDGGRAIVVGVFAPRGRAERTTDGFRVSGRWPFASGVQHCDWAMGGCVVHSDGEPELLPNGMPDVRLMLMPAASLEVLDTWSVAGLRGTGSHDMSASDVLVPPSLSASVLSEPPRAEGPLYRFPLFGLLALGICAVALGVARASIEELIELAAGKVPQAGTRTLAQRATVQRDVAEAEAMLRAARVFVLDEAGAAWEAAQEGALDTERRLGLRLAATHATRTAATVATAMYEAGGGSSIYDTSPLQRRFRDVHVATQHMMVAPATWELAGRLLLGVPTDTLQL